MNITFVENWKPFAIPNKFCDYVNDHTVFVNNSGNLELMGTSANHPYKMHKERSFVRFCQKTSASQTQLIEENLMFDGKFDFLPKISPFVFFENSNSIYHLYFSTLGRIQHFTSADSQNWKYINTPIKSKGPFLRDPCVVEINSTFYMYLTGYGNKIKVYSSNDLIEFNFIGYVLTLGKGVPKSLNSSCESPFVLKHETEFLLFTSIVPSPIGRRENYNKTYVFSSENPFNFGHYSMDKDNSANLVAILDCHAPEIFNFEGKLFITTCGWSNFPKPVGVPKELNGVFVREFKVSV